MTNGIEDLFTEDEQGVLAATVPPPEPTPGLLYFNGAVVGFIAKTPEIAWSCELSWDETEDDE